MIPAAHTRQSQTAAPVPWLALALFAMTVLFPVDAPAAEPAPTGQQLYQSLCADCHGLQGQGVAGSYDDPLTSGRSLQELTKYINDTMPQDEAEKCVGDEAKRVAGYIFDTFYSEADRARHKPPRIELAHLTVRQYLNTAADLIGSFSGEGHMGRQTRLEGHVLQRPQFSRRQERRSNESIRKSPLNSEARAPIRPRSARTSSPSSGRAACWPKKRASTNSA